MSSSETIRLNASEYSPSLHREGSIQYCGSVAAVRVIHQRSTARPHYRTQMEYARFETATLADVDDTYYFAGACSKCKHRRRLRVTKLRAHDGGMLPNTG